jgi:hypothetical protein
MRDKVRSTEAEQASLAGAENIIPKENLNSLEQPMRNEIMTKINDQLGTATANYTSTNDKVLDAVIDANRKAVDFAVKAVDAITMPELPFADRFELPEFPTPAEAGKRYISFVERAADMNRDLNGRIVDMLKIDGAKPVAKTPVAKKPVAKKPVGKKTATEQAPVDATK